MTDHEEKAQLALRSFQSRMNQWEIQFYPLMVQNAIVHRQPALDALKGIFDEFLYSYRDDYGRMSGPDTAFPPDYDPDRDQIVEVTSTKSKVTIQVQQNKGVNNLFRYRLGEHDGRWMIEKTEAMNKRDGKWHSYLP